MTIKDIYSVHYLSCVEAYFGAWIKNYVPLPALYCTSFLPWDEIVSAFASGARYVDFALIPRIQELAEEAGLTLHEKGDLIPTYMNEHDLTLLLVNRSFFTKQIPWREDHYIAVDKLTESKIIFLNEYPMSKAEMFLTDFQEKFGGKCLVYRVQNQDYSLLSRRGDLQREGMKKFFAFKDASSLAVLSLRDAIGILRVSRKRVLTWLEWENPHCAEGLKSVLREQIRFADKSYLQVQTMIIRKKIYQTVLSAMCDGIKAFEAEIIRAAKEDL